MTPHVKQATVSVFTDQEILHQIREITRYISDFLCAKAMYEKVKQDFSNPAKLGGVRFWFQLDPKDNSVILCYDTHPKDWDINQILKDIANQESDFYIHDKGHIRVL